MNLAPFILHIRHTNLKLNLKIKIKIKKIMS